MIDAWKTSPGTTHIRRSKKQEQGSSKVASEIERAPPLASLSLYEVLQVMRLRVVKGVTKALSL